MHLLAGAYFDAEAVVNKSSLKQSVSVKIYRKA